MKTRNRLIGLLTILLMSTAGVIVILASWARMRGVSVFATKVASIYGNGIMQSEEEADITARLRASRGFDKLAQSEKARLLRYVSGRNDYVSECARTGLVAELETTPDDFAKASGFRKFLKDQPYALEQMFSKDWEQVANHNAVKISEPVRVRNYAFRSVKADADKYVATVDSKTIAIYQPVKQTVEMGDFHTPSAIAKTLGQLPLYSLVNIDKVQIEPKANPDDEYWKKHVENFGASYMSGGGDKVINLYPYPTEDDWSYYVQTMVHESGHILTQLRWGEDPDGPRWKPWRLAEASDGLHPSKYAKTAPDEDFAEMFEVYFLCKGTPEETEIKAIFPARFAIVEQLVDASHQKRKAP